MLKRSQGGGLHVAGPSSEALHLSHMDERANVTHEHQYAPPNNGPSPRSTINTICTYIYIYVYIYMCVCVGTRKWVSMCIYAGNMC